MLQTLSRVLAACSVCAELFVSCALMCSVCGFGYLTISQQILITDNLILVESLIFWVCSVMLFLSHEVCVLVLFHVYSFSCSLCCLQCLYPYLLRVWFVWSMWKYRSPRRFGGFTVSCSFDWYAPNCFSDVIHIRLDDSFCCRVNVREGFLTYFGSLFLTALYVSGYWYPRNLKESDEWIVDGNIYCHLIMI